MTDDIAYPDYPHMCRDGHIEIGHSDSDNEQCPLCKAVAALEPFAKLAEYTSGKHRDSRPICYGLDSTFLEKITIGDLRRAQEVLHALVGGVGHD